MRKNSPASTIYQKKAEGRRQKAEGNYDSPSPTYQNNWVAQSRLDWQNVFGCLLKYLLQKQLLTSDFINHQQVQAELIVR
ncbi:MAG: hypothetical protein F6K18_31695 [Okeania sp. SIO2C2]|uniref:hypothetical protein n=1 Tax=Okeania sp. SIO2C2 TaxID=2607787 RepID=UPI0013BA9D38|nr:hypothetical protein [Okeania sp. SIO2C2]NEP91012.1 hypothetical protein [Okeania sp. SIO2C2]